MKTNFLSLAVLFSILLGIASCGKEKSEDGFYGQWNVDGLSFEANRQGGILLATDTASLFGASAGISNNIVFLFKTRPTSNKNYKIAPVGQSIKDVDENTCFLFITNNTKPVTTYIATDSVNTVSVTLDGGKIRAEFSDLAFQYLSPAIEIINTTGSGFVLEK